MRDKIEPNPKHEPSKEELLRKSAEKPASWRFTVEASFDEEEVVVIGYADCELRDLDVPMRLQVTDGTSQEKFLFLLREIEDEARNNWDEFLHSSRWYYHPPASPEDPDSHEDGSIA
jgi:hypothetical protein